MQKVKYMVKLCMFSCLAVQGGMGAGLLFARIVTIIVLLLMCCFEMCKHLGTYFKAIIILYVLYALSE